MRFSTRGVLATLLALVVAGVCVRLGFWQLDRLEQRRARNSSLEAALALPVLELGDSLAYLFHAPDRYLNRRVRARGRYDSTRELLLRGRVHEGRPGVHLLTPLLLSGDTAVMVNRGWLPAPDAASVDPAPHRESGDREILALVMPAPQSGDGDPARSSGAGVPITFARLPLDSLRAAGGPPLLPVYLQQLPGESDDSLPRRVPAPTLGEGPHLGYAVQWFSFAAIALGGLSFLVFRGSKRGS